MKRTLLFFLVLISLVGTLLMNSGCANIIPPLGGPRDSLPPVLVSATPADSTLNFKGNRISLTFDEYVDLQNVTENLLFNPLFERPSEVSVRLKTITVRILDTLEPNTTYSFNFGNAIKDVNEGNPFRQFTYTFSTGSYLDSLQVSGRVLLAESGKIDTTITVVLHTDFTDSAVVKSRPRYAARLDSSGRFTFRNLPRATYAIYAIGEAGTMRRYTSPTQYFAFADSLVVSGSGKAVTLYAFQEQTEEETNRGAARTTTTRGNNAANNRLRLGSSAAGGQQDLLTDLVLTSEQPLRNLDTTKVRLTRDSAFTPVANYTLTLDTTGKNLSIRTAWQEATLYNLIIDQDFAEDTLGRKLLKADTLRFTTRKRAEYGRLQLRVQNVQAAQKPVLLFVQNDKVVFSTPIGTGVFTQELFMPGEYELRILYDRNGNGHWDTGKFFEGRLQPEIVVPVGRSITVKPAWENEVDVVAPAGNGTANSP